MKQTAINKLKVNEEELLAPYVSNDDFRAKLMKPFLSNGYVCASDIYALLMVKEELLSGKYESNGIDVTNVITKSNNRAVYTLEELQKAVCDSMTGDEEKIVSPRIDCDECDGDGTVEWEYISSFGRRFTQYFDCPICEGSGVIADAIVRKTGKKCALDDDLISIQSLKFQTTQIAKMCETMKLLSIDKAEYIARHQSKGNRFRLAEGIEVIIMPNNLPQEAKVHLKHKKQ